MYPACFCVGAVNDLSDGGSGFEVKDQVIVNVVFEKQERVIGVYSGQAKKIVLESIDQGGGVDLAPDHHSTLSATEGGGKAGGINVNAVIRTIKVRAGITVTNPRLSKVNAGVGTVAGVSAFVGGD